MSFQEWNIFYYVVLLLVVFGLLYIRFEKKALSWLNCYFFKRPSRTYKIKNILFSTGLILMGLACMDLRGPEKQVKIEMKTQKTAILIDSSASMAVEDVRPNRFEKALMVAMHFVKNSAGHKIAVFIFSNETKQVVPFTDDIDHINARIEALDQYRTLSGTSNLSLAINEVSNYFKDEEGEGGNILVFTDGEEHSSGMEVDLNEKLTLGIVGVGTAKGGRVPIRDNYNILRGYKKFDGKEVISKLDENFLKDSFKSVENYNYWIVSGYVMPTDKILAFFKNSFISKNQKGTQRVRPVLGNILLVPACLLLMISYLLGNLKLLHGVSLILLLFVIPRGEAQGQQEPEEKPVLSKDEQLVFNGLIERHKKGDLDKGEEKYLAGKFLKMKEFEKASTVYDDAISFPENERAETLMNYGTSLIGSKNFSKGVDMLEMALSKVDKNNPDSKEMEEQIRQNILLALKQEEQRKKQQQQKEDQEKDKNDKDKNKSDQDKQKNGEDKDNKKDQDKQKNGEDKDNKKDQDKKDNNNQDKKKDNEQGKEKKKKLSALMKEILNDDKKLQKKLLDTSRGQKGGGANVKDW